MPWNSAKSLEDIRKEFLDRCNGKSPVSVLCREYGISRKTAYKWMRRAKDGETLKDRSRRPKSSPNSSSPEIVDLVLDIRRRHPTIGGGKISTMLQRRGVLNVPTGSTITEILRRNDMLNPRAIAEAKHLIRFEKEHPNEMWQMDFKGHFPLDTGERCHPLNIIDDRSRYAILSAPVLDETFKTVKPRLISAFREYGLPNTILCDNGHPWGAPNRYGITSLETWAMELDVLILHERPYHPQTQGKDERFNKTWKREVLEKFKGCPPSLEDVIAETNAFVDFYNHERPHYGLGGKCPCDVYCKSEREYPERIHEWVYPAEFLVRRVDVRGCIWMRSERFFVGEGLIGKRIAMKPSTSHLGCVNLYFRDFKIGRLNLPTKRIEYLRAYRMTGDPRL